ncbi:MAG TPA: hypothetical protein VMI54_16975 [Polyangiaceae bacterium]|nr:hypothetical protein [Polyangiaceae bacterium]
MTPLSKRLLVALAISGALNLLCAGIFVGGFIHRSRARAARAAFELGRGARDANPRAGRRPGPFGGLLASHHDQMLERRRATADARKAVVAGLEHEPFDPAALDRALVALRSETAKTQEFVHQTVEQAARDGDAAAREKLAHGFERPAPPP